MSTRRVKAIDYDDDDYEIDDYDGDDYEYQENAEPGKQGELSDYDKEQMRIGTAKVRDALDSTPATDKEIQEALWHYYYDVAQSVSYLKSKVKSKAAPKQSKPVPSKFTDPIGQLPQPPSTIPQGFFSDCPWLQVPDHRRAEIIVQAIWPRGGLLGGSSKEGKMSKLAALAAKRRQKENQNPAASTLSKEPGPESYEASLSKLSLTSPPLEKFSTRTKETAANQSIASTPTSAGPETIGASPNEQEDDIMHDAPALQSKDEEAVVVARASPSTFARVVLANDVSADFANKIVLPDSSATRFDSFGPSPDDVISLAQRGKVTPTTKSKTREAPKTKTDVSNGIANLHITEPVKMKSKNIDVVAEYKKVQRKNAANFVVIGHVDAGKSTLMGRLLFDLKAIDQRTMDKYKKEADTIGKGSFAFAWVLDEGTEERERGVTIDIATNKFETAKTCFTILDAPGHQDFVPNMIAGASQADFAVLVIDASGSNFESGLRGQTKEHALLARSIGVQRMIVAVNKMDTTGWSQERYTEIQQQMAAFLSSAGFQPKTTAFVPCSGLEGDNILKPLTDPRATWHKGHTLVEELDLSEPSTSFALEKPLRMTISDVFRGGIQNPLSISGRLESGTLQPGDLITVMPSSQPATIKSLELDNESVDWAVAGQTPTLHLSDIDPLHIRTGDVIFKSADNKPITNITAFPAKILAFTPLTPSLVDVHRGRLHVPGRIASLVATLDKASGEVSKKKPKVVQPGNVVRVIVNLESPSPLEVGQRVVFRAGGETVAAGLIE